MIESIQTQNKPELAKVYMKDILYRMLIPNSKQRISSAQLCIKLEVISKKKKLLDFKLRKADLCNILVFKNRKYILSEKKKDKLGYGTVFIVEDPHDYEK